MIQFGLGGQPGFPEVVEPTNLICLVCGRSEHNLSESVIMTRNYAIRSSVIAGVVASLALVSSLMTSAVVADDATPTPALKAIQGTWVTTESDSIDAKWEIKGEALKASVNGMEYVGKVKVDDKAKPHSTLDINLTDGPEDAKGKTAKAVYKVDGEKLVIAVAVPGHDRPKDFEPAPDEVYLFELKKKS